eukprot:TRINITY_DN5996_c0_g1_i3.p1 TRINITY_DN5996_c0_g1~~TRINITY_DN5996_c0_g1_i3.p1  ORF type:complete len:135 (-),score=26.80 TRINITY_DN5996_c0_g1_i3:449-853(-)
MTEFFCSGQPFLTEESTVHARGTLIEEGDSEAVVMIKELLETRIRPALQADGGDLSFMGFVGGVVFVQLQGSCGGCPSSSATLKGGVERMLTHWIPEVKGVVPVESKEEYLQLTQNHSKSYPLGEENPSQNSRE